MRVGMVIPYFPPAWQYGGTPRAAFELARALVARGHQVRVLTTDSAGDTRLEPSALSNETVNGIEVHYYRNLSNYLAYRQRLFFAPRFHAELRKQLSDCDVLHIHELRSTLTIPAVRVARQLSLPYVLSPHGGLKHLGKHPAKAVFDFLWGRSILDGAAAVLVLTKREEIDALAFQVRPSQIRHLPNVIEPSDYATLPPPGRFKSSRNLGAAKLILFLGRLHAIKGVDLLVEAFASLIQQHRDTVLVLAGPDDGEEANIRRMLEKLGIQNKVVLTGFLDLPSKLEAFVDSDVVVLPSRSEGFPIVVAEALLCERPIVASSACELPMPRPDHFGILQFQTLDWQDLRDKLLFALTHRDLSNNAIAGHQFILREFSPNVVAEKAEAIFKEAVFPASRSPQA